MKTRLILFSLLASATLAHAHLINLTPGGWNMNNGLPPGFERTYQQTFFDDATPNGWTSQFGRINGGTYFFTDLFKQQSATEAQVWWDFTGQPEGFFLTTVTIFGYALNGDPWMSIYRVSASEWFGSFENHVVTLNREVTILNVAFYGLNSIPDNGSTLMLLAGAVALLFVFRAVREY